MKVLYMSPPSNRPGQIGRYTFLDEEIAALAQSGVEVHVLSPVPRPEIQIPRVHIWTMPRGRGFGAAAGTLAFWRRYASMLSKWNLFAFEYAYATVAIERFAAELVQSHQIDIIHSHFAWPKGSGGQLVRAATGRPLIASFRGSDLSVGPSEDYGRRRNGFFDRAVRSLLATANQTLYFSDFMRDQGLDLGANPSAARLIRKGVHLDRFRYEPDKTVAKRALGLDASALILSVGGVTPVKDMGTVIRALPSLAQRNYRYVICGHGPDQPMLEQLATDLGVRSRVQFAGTISREQIATYFAAADVFVLSSLVESSPNVLMEALASGCPVISTNAGGAPEYVQEGVTGFVVPVGDSTAIGARLCTLLDDEILRERFGRAAHEWAIADFNYARMIGEYLDVYKQALASDSGLHAAVLSAARN